MAEKEISVCLRRLVRLGVTLLLTRTRCCGLGKLKARKVKRPMANFSRRGCGSARSEESK